MQEDKIKVLEGMDVYFPDVDGVITCMHNYCLNSYKDIDLTAIAPKNTKKYKDEFPYKIIRCNSIYVPFLKMYYGTPMADAKFVKQIMSEKYDIIHIHSPFNMGVFALKVAKKQGIPIVATFHSNFRPIFKSILKSNALTELVVKSIGNFYNKLDECFVCSPQVASQLRSFGYKGKISYLPYGSDYPKCTNKQELIIKANKTYSLSENLLTFLFVGRIMELKRIDVIIRSLSIVKQHGFKFVFFVVGKGVYLAKLQELVKSLDMEEEVKFLGFISKEQLEQLYARCNLFLFPSLYDNFGLVKVEAAAYDTPGLFIAGSQTGYGVTDNVNGFLSEDSDEAFAKKIEEVIKDRNMLKQVGINAGRDLYINWEQCTKLVVEKYKQVIADAKITPPKNAKKVRAKIIKEKKDKKSIKTLKKIKVIK